ncbi:hypothetical protein BJ996_000015 [Streptomyces phaeogriseichromatogenes]|nr:hypothetical protein [Streptomyces murinus]
MNSLSIAERYGHPLYVAHQVYYSLIGRDYEWELMPLGLDQGLGALVWSPLGWGRLTGKIRRGQPLPANSRLHRTADYGPPVEDEHLYRVVDALDEIAQETGKKIPQIAINWLLQRPTVSSVIIGARNEEQLRQNLGAVGWTLTPEQLAKLNAASGKVAAYTAGGRTCGRPRGGPLVRSCRDRSHLAPSPPLTGADADAGDRPPRPRTRSAAPATRGCSTRQDAGGHRRPAPHPPRRRTQGHRAASGPHG